MRRDGSLLEHAQRAASWPDRRAARSKSSFTGFGEAVQSFACMPFKAPTSPCLPGKLRRYAISNPIGCGERSAVKLMSFGCVSRVKVLA